MAEYQRRQPARKPVLMILGPGLFIEATSRAEIIRICGTQLFEKKACYFRAALLFCNVMVPYLL